MLKHMLRERLLASFQDLEHEGGDTRSQGGIKDNDIKIKIQDHRHENGSSKGVPKNTKLQVSRKIMLSSFKLNDHPLGGDFPPPYTGNFMPPTPDLSYTGLDEFANKTVVENMFSEEETKPKTVFNVVKGNNLNADYEEIDGGYVTFRGNPKGGRITRKRIENLVDHKVKVIRCDNRTEFKNREMNQFCKMKDHLGKFNGKADEGFFVGYFLKSKAFRVFNSRIRIVEENLHIRFSENTPNVVGSEPDWLFDIDALTRTINYEPIVAGTQSNGFVGTKASDNASQVRKETEPVKDYILLPLWTADPPFFQDPKISHDDGSKPSSDNGKSIFNFLSDDEDDGAMANMNNLDTTIQVSPTPAIRIHKDHPLDQVIGDLHSTTQTRIMLKNLEEHGFEELLQFKLQEVWTLVELPNEKSAIGTKWVFKNKKDEKGIEIRNKAILIAQGPKTTAWNEFSSIVASAIICLATSKKFNFSKWIFDSMIRNLDNVSMKFLMYPRVGKGFSRRITPLFSTMIVQSELGEGSAMPTDPHHTPTILQSSSSQPQNTHKPRKPTRKATRVPQPSDPIEHVADKAVSLVRDAITASSLDTEQDNDGGPRCQEAMGDTTTQTRFVSVYKLFNNSLLARGNTLQSDEDIMELNELMALYTNLQTRVLDLEKTKTSQCNEIASLKRSVKKLEKKNRSRTHKLKRLYKVGLTARVESLDEESLDDVEMLDVSDLGGEEVFVAEQEVVKGIVIQKQEEPGKSKTTTTISKHQSHDKGKGIMIEEPVKPKKKDQIMLDEEAAKRLQAKFDKEDKLARERAQKEQEANIALIETWDDIQAKIDADHQLAERIQAKEKEELSNAEKDTLFEMFDRTFKSVNTFIHFRSELVEGKQKRAGEELIQKSIMKQKAEDDKETVELQKLMEIIPDKKEVAIDAIPLAVKSLKIVDWKIYKEGKEDLEDLYKLVKDKFKSTRPVEDLDFLLWGDLKIMFEPHVEDAIWKKQQGYKVLEWKLYDSCGVHSLRMQSMQIYMLVEKTYPLTPPTLTMMLEKKLQIDY
uniref:Uncharacterized protein n=1 Tax=Tanacetum cinerariifolium TaxID=118510 RepID=A0A6L2L1Z7_TANCI|nr:hypothetical protein [Tanacetum cinerariifolium]